MSELRPNKYVVSYFFVGNDKRSGYGRICISRPTRILTAADVIEIEEEIIRHTNGDFKSATITSIFRMEDDSADITLADAAPDLLAALVALTGDCELLNNLLCINLDAPMVDEKLIEQARAAIAKAKGE